MNEWEEDDGFLKRGLYEWFLIAVAVAAVAGLLALVVGHLYADILLRLARIFSGR